MNQLCKNCSTVLKGKFCHSCGQKMITINERTLKHLLEEFFHYFSHLDGKFIKTLKLVIFKPGQVTNDISNGITVKHFKISTFFLLGALVYFLLPQHFIGYGFLNTPFQEQMNSGVLREWKVQKANNEIKFLNTTEADYEKEYDKKLQLNGKLLTLLLIPLTIPILLIINLFLRLLLRKHHFTTYDLAIGALEINSAIVYIVFLLIGVTISIINKLFIGNFENNYFQIFNVVFILLIMALYFYSFFKRAYQIKWFQSVVCLLLFVLGYAFVISFYQLLSFMILS